MIHTMALKDMKREELDDLAKEKGLDPAAYHTKDDLATALENAGVTDDRDDEAAQSVAETREPRDPSQAIPEIALQRYLDPREAGATSNAQL